MIFQKLRKYIIEQFGTNEKKVEGFNFENTFSEVLQHNTTHEEGLILLMVLAPHVHPGFYDSLLKELYPEGGEFPEWGGFKEDNYRSMQPTGETIQYILAQHNLQERIRIQSYFTTQHWFFKDQVLYLEMPKVGMPFMSSKIIVPTEIVQLLLFGQIDKPSFDSQFPAKELTTELNWEDLVLNRDTQEQITQLRLWIKHGNTLRNDWGLSKRIAPGFRCLFHGPSGTGKTLTASLLGKEFGLPVYRIDLSQVVSKYIGETEKNLERIFLKAENKNWILFFDEADALFGKRSSTKSSQDKFANQQISFLLQRIEYFNGIVILASNLKNNIDQAFLRRLNVVVLFTKPNVVERLVLWNKVLPKNILLDKPDQLEKIAQHYEITAAQIVNAFNYAAIQAIEKKAKTLSVVDLLKGIRLEFEKEEKIFINQIN